MEIMIVVTIIGILAALVAPKLLHAMPAAKEKATRAEISSIKTALGSFNLQFGRFPEKQEGLKALVDRPQSVDEKDWPEGGYLDDIPLDGWGKEFAYVYPSEHGKEFDLISGGKDQKIGTEDDICSWKR